MVCIPLSIQLCSLSLLLPLRLLLELGWREFKFLLTVGQPALFPPRNRLPVHFNALVFFVQGLLITTLHPELDIRGPENDPDIEFYLHVLPPQMVPVLVLLFEFNILAFHGGDDVAKAGYAVLGDVGGEVLTQETGDEDVGLPFRLIVARLDFQNVRFADTVSRDGFALMRRPFSTSCQFLMSK